MSTDQEGVRSGGDCRGSPWLPGAGRGAPDGGVHSAAVFLSRRSSCESSCSSSPWCSDVCVWGGGMCLCVVCVCAHVTFACVCVCCLSHTFVIPGQKTSRSGVCDQPAVAQYVWQHSSPRHHHHRHHGACELALFSFLEKTSFCFSGNAKNDQTEMWKYKQHQKWLMLTLKIRNHLYVT